MDKWKKHKLDDGTYVVFKDNMKGEERRFVNTEEEAKKIKKQLNDALQENHDE